MDSCCPNDECIHIGNPIFPPIILYQERAELVVIKFYNKLIKTN